MKCNTFHTVTRGIPSSQLRRRVDARGVRSMASRIVFTLPWDTGDRPDPVRINLFTSIWMFCCFRAGFLNLSWKASLTCRYVYTPDNNCNPFYYCKHSGICKINSISQLEVKNILGLYRHPVLGIFQLYKCGRLPISEHLSRIIKVGTLICLLQVRMWFDQRRNVKQKN